MSVFQNTEREILQDLISIQFLCDRTFSLFLFRNRTMDVVPSRTPNATDTMKYERKYQVEILGGFSFGIALGSRDAIRWQSEIHAVYKPVMPRDATRRAQPEALRLQSAATRRLLNLYYTRWKSQRVSRKGGRSCANVSGSRVARYCNLTYDPPLLTQLYLKHTSLPACLSVRLSVRLSSRFRYRPVSHDRSGRFLSDLVHFDMRRAAKTVPDKKSLAAIETELRSRVDPYSRFGIELEACCLFERI